ncbi:hypothetical protein CERZMDRAFT_45500 [Cercospora zeae-maydis SCOH1-5]|uniref:Peptidase A1 domain-containing protein n=1 Tax=Cercospora zeae-maydis SCOH1-5 TaxID=717836 RepID=A0A6A6FAN6_9PEZI|nr:hypothetical protein CERZMDRAFT_45500 [Cercospora zeae-maydis SCOH1-5]
MSNAESPLLIPSSGWGGNDGKWSTFEIDVGTPAQRFSVLPSTSDGEIWVPVPEGCDSSIPDCTSSRGIEAVNGVQSSGFQSNESSSWKQIGIYDLGADDSLFPNSGDAALYGLDNVSLGALNAPSLSSQVVGGISSFNFWLGIIGLGAQPVRFSNLPDTAATVLGSARAQNLSASVSYGFSAGAAYLLGNAPGSIIMGGYDRAAFEPSNISFPLAFAGSRSLTARLKNLVITSTLQGTLSPPIESAGLNMSIDSTFAQIWLPGSICDTLSDALGLQYDNNTELYFVNSSVHQSLLSQAPEFTFTLAAASSPNATTNIVLPYAAFDQQIGQPWSTEDTTYFPIRRAANESQFVLGRTFLQEAYLVVDWERENFTLGRSLHRPGVSNDIVTIEPVTREGTSSKMSIGAIAGIAVGAVLLIAAICGGIWFYRRKKRREKRARDDVADAEARARVEAAVDMYPSDKKDPIGEHEGDAELPGHSRPNKLEAELMGEYRHEMPSPYKEKDNVFVSESLERPELYGGDSAQLLGSNEIYELPGHEMANEMDAPASVQASERYVHMFWQ